MIMMLLGNGLLPMFAVSGSVPIVTNWDLNVDGTLSAWDIGDGTILEAWR